MREIIAQLEYLERKTDGQDWEKDRTTKVENTKQPIEEKTPRGWKRKMKTDFAYFLLNFLGHPAKTKNIGKGRFSLPIQSINKKVNLKIKSFYMKGKEIYSNLLNSFSNML